MKNVFLLALALSSLFCAQRSFAFSICALNHPENVMLNCFELQDRLGWLIISSTSAPVVIIADSSLDLNSPNGRETLAVQADLVLSHGSDSINPSENLIASIAKGLNKSDEDVAKAVQSIQRTNAPMSVAAIQAELSK